MVVVLFAMKPAQKVRKLNGSVSDADEVMATGTDASSEASLSIDLFNVQDVHVFSSDGEIDDPLHYLPVVSVQSCHSLLYRPDAIHE